MRFFLIATGNFTFFRRGSSLLTPQNFAPKKKVLPYCHRLRSSLLPPPPLFSGLISATSLGLGSSWVTSTSVGSGSFSGSGSVLGGLLLFLGSKRMILLSFFLGRRAVPKDESSPMVSLQYKYLLYHSEKVSHNLYICYMVHFPILVIFGPVKLRTILVGFLFCNSLFLCILAYV